MQDLNRALTDLSLIREQLTRDTQFRGYGPTTLAATGVLALIVAAVQMRWLNDPASAVQRSMSLWIWAAAICFAAIVLEAVWRSRREHGGLALTMLKSVVEQFLPAIVAGGLLTVVLEIAVPQSLWMLPGLWQILFSLGVFASCRYLPRPMFIVGIWYMACGLGCLVLTVPRHLFSPWIMGIPFGVGQMLVAAVLQYGRWKKREEEDEYI